MQIFHNPNFNFVKYRWPALIVSWVLILAGIVGIYLKGIPLGVEFSGGTIVIVQFDTMPQHRPGPRRARQGRSAAARTSWCRSTARGRSARS